MYNRNNGFGSYDDPVEETNFYPKRPLSITVVGIVITLALVVSLISLANVTGDPSLSIPLWYWILTAGQVALVIASIAGLWQMHKWGAYTYTANFIINVIILVSAFIFGFDFNILSLLLPIVLLFFIYRKFDEMS